MNFKFNFFKIIFAFTFLTSLNATNIWSIEYCKNSQNNYCKLREKFNLPANTLLIGLNDGIGMVKHMIQNKKLTLYGSHSVAREPYETKRRFQDLEPGFNFYYEPGTRKNAGYLLLSRFAAENDGETSTELWDLNNQKLINRYNINWKNIKKNLNKSDLSDLFLNPILLEDGSLILNSVGGWGGAIVKVDNCGNYQNHNLDYLFHHSIEVDKKGLIYAPIENATKNLNKDGKHLDSFSDHGFAILDNNLNILKKYSLLEIYKKHNLSSDVYGGDAYSNNPFHLNTVMPFNRSDGKDIVILSLLTQSSVIAYDLNKEEIIWKIERATTHQHDVDIINVKGDFIDISIFDNNTPYFLNNSDSTGNEIVTFNSLPTKINNNFFTIADDKIQKKYSLKRLSFNYLPKDYMPITITGGRSDFLLENNSLMIEETDYGRLFEIELDTKKILWQYINKEKKDVAPFQMTWSRRYIKLPGQLNVNNFKSCQNS